MDNFTLILRTFKTLLSVLARMNKQKLSLRHRKFEKKKHQPDLTDIIYLYNQ